MKPSRFLAITVLVALAFFSNPRDADAILAERVSLDTFGLSAPFELAYILSDGSGSGDANTTIMLDAFDFGAGGSAGSVDGVLTTGGASGDLASGVTLIDNTFLSIFASSFIPGPRLSFQITSTTDVDAGGTPDQLSLVLLDAGGIVIGSQDPTGIGSLLTLELAGSGTSIATFAGDLTPAPVVTPVTTSVPEPPALSLLVLAFVFGIRSIAFGRKPC